MRTFLGGVLIGFGLLDVLSVWQALSVLIGILFIAQAEIDRHEQKSKLGDK